MPLATFRHKKKRGLSVGTVDERLDSHSKKRYVVYLLQMRWQTIKKRGGLNNERLPDQRDRKRDVFKQVRIFKSCFIYALFKRKS